jgi:hypothetical protein
MKKPENARVARLPASYSENASAVGVYCAGAIFFEPFL